MIVIGWPVSDTTLRPDDQHLTPINVVGVPVRWRQRRSQTVLLSPPTFTDWTTSSCQFVRVRYTDKERKRADKTEREEGEKHKRRGGEKTKREMEGGVKSKREEKGKSKRREERARHFKTERGKYEMMHGRRKERCPQSILGLAVLPSLAVTESEPFACHVVRWTSTRDQPVMSSLYSV